MWRKVCDSNHLVVLGIFGLSGLLQGVMMLKGSRIYYYKRAAHCNDYMARYGRPCTNLIIEN